MVNTKYAIIKTKNDITGAIEAEGKAILLNCLDQELTRGFWEYRLLEDMSTTHCDWIDNNSITEGE